MPRGRTNEWIAKRLADLNMKNRELATLLDVPAPRITELIKGEWPLDIARLPAFCRALQISADQAIVGLIDHHLAQQATITATTPGKVDVSELWSVIRSVVLVDRQSRQAYKPETLADKATQVFLENATGIEPEPVDLKVWRALALNGSEKPTPESDS